MKRCKNCDEIKDFDAFYNMSRSSDGKQHMCIPCYRKYFKEWRKNRNEMPQTEFPTSKICWGCKTEKPISQFGKRSVSKDKHLDWCRPCWRIETRKAIKRMKERHANEQVSNSL